MEVCDIINSRQQIRCSRLFSYNKEKVNSKLKTEKCKYDEIFFYTVLITGW